MRIGELATEAGVTTKTVRYYESLGLLPEADRTASGYRSYDGAALERLRFVRDAQATGLSLTEIRSIVELKDQGDRSCEHTRELLHRHLHELDEQIERLRVARAALAELASRADDVDPADCTDPHRCQVIEGSVA
ncbi:MAG: heavy metal-responsive transcriptional regulator [Ilumatobacter sp.]|nr:heavy metal-responsive transcriptional regulator [Ilumatobacter sp.]